MSKQIKDTGGADKIVVDAVVISGKSKKSPNTFYDVFTYGDLGQYDDPEEAIDSVNKIFVLEETLGGAVIRKAKVTIEFIDGDVNG